MSEQIKAPPVECCARCRFTAPAEGDGDVLSCARFPPTASARPVQQRNAITNEIQAGLRVEAHFPPVADDAWCGEFQRREDDTDGE